MVANLVQSYTRSQQILTQVTPDNQTSVITLYQPGLVTPWDRTSSLRYYGFISDLRVNIDISSLPETQIPQLDLGASRTERLTAVKQMEWGSPRYELDMLMKKSNTGWLPVASLSLLNRRPYYLINVLNYLTDQVAFQVANDAVLGIRVRDVGHGLMNGDDRLTFFGAVKEEVSTIPSEFPEITLSQDYFVNVGDTSTIVLPANAGRKQATFVNTSDSHKVFLSYAAVAQLNKGILLYPNGGSYEINLGQNLYKGAITAISEDTANLSILEGV